MSNEHCLTREQKDALRRVVAAITEMQVNECLTGLYDAVPDACAACALKTVVLGFLARLATEIALASDADLEEATHYALALQVWVEDACAHLAQARADRPTRDPRMH